MHQRAKHYRLFGNIAYMFAAAMVIAALLVNAVPPRAAAAHSASISSSVACQSDGTKRVTWTISNSQGASQPMTITVSSNHTVLPIGTVVNTSIQVFQSFPGTQHGNVSFSLTGHWTDGVNSNASDSQNLGNNNCPQPPPPDVCPNIPGNQATMPVGYQLDNNGNCVPIPPPPVDLCPNIDGVQTTMPVGYQLDNNGNCVPIPPPPVDLCPNIDGVQTTMPVGFQLDNNGNCVPIPPPPVDLCPNIDGVQTTMPVGYQLDNNGNCVPIPPPPTDVCPNIDGVQTSMPEGYQYDNNGNCVPVPPPPTDVCPNIDGVQTSMPDGYQYDNNGNCVPVPPPPTDVCPNIDGVQTSMPEGYQYDNNGNCVPVPPPPDDFCPNIEGVQTSMPDGYQYDENGNCVPAPPPPTDVCPNIAGLQTSLPQGMQFDNDGNCVPIPPPPVDLCPNIDGLQATVPLGMIINNEGNCVPPPVDVCPNIEGLQTVVPDGMQHDVNGDCVPIPPAQITICYNHETMTVFVTDLYLYPGFTEGECPPPPDLCPNLDGVQETMPAGYQYNIEGDCVPIPPPPPDFCPNLDGIQESIPEGMELNNDGNCVPIPPPPVDVCPNIEGLQTFMPEGLQHDEEGNCVPVPPAQITICYNNQTMTVFVTDLEQYPGFLEGECPPPPAPSATVICYSLEDGAFRLTVINNGAAGEIGYSTDLDSTIYSLGTFVNGESQIFEVPGGVSVVYVYGKLQTGWTDGVSLTLDRSKVGTCEEDPISLTFTCTQDSETPSSWEITNLNNFAIDITWAIDGGPSDGPITIPAHGTYGFSTAYFAGEMNVYVNGVLLAHRFAQNCNERQFQTLSVAAFCTSASPGTYGWLVANPNSFDVQFEWRVVGSAAAGLLTVGANSTATFQTDQSFGTIINILFGGNLQDSATGVATCSSGPPAPRPTPTSPVIPPTGGGPVLIPVTGLDLSTPGLASMALFNLGLVFFGLGIVLQGLARRRETNE